MIIHGFELEALYLLMLVHALVFWRARGYSTPYLFSYFR